MEWTGWWEALRGWWQATYKQLKVMVGEQSCVSFDRMWGDFPIHQQNLSEEIASNRRCQAQLMYINTGDQKGHRKACERCTDWLHWGFHMPSGRMHCLLQMLEYFQKWACSLVKTGPLYCETRAIALVWVSQLCMQMHVRCMQKVPGSIPNHTRLGKVLSWNAGEPLSPSTDTSEWDGPLVWLGSFIC